MRYSQKHSCYSFSHVARRICNVFRKCYKFQRNFLNITGRQNFCVFLVLSFLFLFVVLVYFILVGFENTLALCLPNEKSFFLSHAYANRFYERRGGGF